VDDTHDFKHLFINPYSAITIDPGLATRHDPTIDESQWIRANVILIDRIGAEEWLTRLLAVLQGDYPRNPNDPGRPDGYRSEE
jgi:hypothetical protein